MARRVSDDSRREQPDEDEELEPRNQRRPREETPEEPNPSLEQEFAENEDDIRDTLPATPPPVEPGQGRRQQKDHHQHHQHRHRRQHRHRPHSPHTKVEGRVKEMIKPDPTVRRARSMAAHSPGAAAAAAYHIVHPPASSSLADQRRPETAPQQQQQQQQQQVATAVDEEQLHRRLMQSVSEKRLRKSVEATTSSTKSTASAAKSLAGETRGTRSNSSNSSSSRSHKSSSSCSKSASASGGGGGGAQRTAGFQVHEPRARSPPVATIIIPANVARSLSIKAAALQAGPVGAQSSSPSQQLSGQQQPQQQQQRYGTGQATRRSAAGVRSPDSQSSLISREQLEYGPLLKSNEVQVLFRSPDADSIGLDRHLKDEQARQVAPGTKQSPVAIMSVNPAYELQNKPLVLEYPATVENLRLNNTGFSWELKIPYQISMTTALYGAHLSQTQRFRLDQLHCHWGASEHTVDGRSYTAELHFVHYNMEKYHTLAKAARHSDGLVVLSVFVDAHAEHHNHAELEKIVSHLKSVQLKGEHTIVRQAVRLDNLLPTNRSYWSYQGSLTTPPFLESVTWFVLKYPIRCNLTQVEKFKQLRSSVRRDQDDQVFIRSNYRKTQPLNGRTIVSFDESASGFMSSSSASSASRLANARLNNNNNN